MLKITIDNKCCAAEAGETVLQVARRNNLWIPTLCYHPAMEPYASCRLCLVEVGNGKGWQMVTACNYVVWHDLAVRLSSEAVVCHRQGVMRLLLARASGLGRTSRACRTPGSPRRGPSHGDGGGGPLHPLRPLRAGLRRADRDRGDLAVRPRRRAQGVNAVRRTFGGVHSLRRVRRRSVPSGRSRWRSAKRKPNFTPSAPRARCAAVPSAAKYWRPNWCSGP